jgi:hypothetical protein
MPLTQWAPAQGCQRPARAPLLLAAAPTPRAACSLCRRQIPEGPDAQAAVRLLKRINELSCQGQCAIGSGGKSVG